MPQDNQPPQEPQKPFNDPPQQPYPQQQYPQQQYPHQPLPPQQDFPSQPGVPPYPNYQPQPGQHPYHQPPRQESMPPIPPTQPSPRSKTFLSRKIWKLPIWAWIIFVVFAIYLIGNMSTGGQAGSTSNTSASATNTPAPTDTPIPTDTPAPTDTPVPTISPAQTEKLYKALTTSTTVDSLDKNGNSWQGKDIHFTCTILNFVKDNTGNTAGANVDDPNSSGVVQVAFPNNTDLSRLNTGDTLEVWGTDDGTSSGTNAFGATIQEVGISAQYMTDQTTNYQAH